MDAPSRRSLLRASGPLVAALAGCSAFDLTTESSPSDSPSDDSPTASPLPGRSALSHSGAVVEQATDTAPARVELRLTNESARPVFPLPTSAGSLPAGVLRAGGETGELVCFPPSGPNVHAFGLADSRVDGCWRFETTGGKGIQPAYNPVEASTERLGPGKTVRSVHDVYYSGPDDACFPAGTYETATERQFGTSADQQAGDVSGATFELGYQFDVSAAGSVSVDAADVTYAAD